LCLFNLCVLFFAHNSIKYKADNKHCCCYNNPAKSKVIQWQGTADCADKAKGDADAVDCIDYTDNRCAKDCKRIDKSVAFDKVIAEAENNQHNGNRIDCVEYRHRDAEDCVEPLVADCKGEDCDAYNKFVVADAFEQSGKIL